jgi:hypothetical protein
MRDDAMMTKRPFFVFMIYPPVKSDRGLRGAQNLNNLNKPIRRDV